MAGTLAVEAVEWLTKLGDLHERFPAEKDKLEKREFESLSNMAAIVGLVRDLSTLVGLPPFSAGKGQAFCSRLRNLDKKVNKSKSQVDVSQFAYPLASLKEPGMAEKCLEGINDVLKQQTGKRLETLHQDMVRECLVYILRQVQESKASSDRSAKQLPSFPGTAISSSETSQTARRRAKKKKTRWTKDIFEVTS